MSKTTDYANTPPRTMPTKFARQGETIRRLQQELDAAKQTIAKLEEAQRLEVLVDGGIHGILLYGHAVDSRAASGIFAAYGYGNPDELCLCRKVTAKDAAKSVGTPEGEAK